MAKTRNMLKDGEKYKLWALIQENKASLERGDWTYGKFAQHASEVIGCTITDKNIQWALKAIGIVTPTKIRRNGMATTNGLRVALRVVANELARCTGEFGCLTTEQFKAVVDQLNGESNDG